MPLPADPTAPTDFDFIIGEWRVHHRRLNARLAGCTEWTTFEGHTVTRDILGGSGNLEDNLMHFPTGDVRAVALRSYSPASRSWSIWWLDGRHPAALDTPVIGSFAGPIGTFFADDLFDGRPIRIRFVWTAHPAAAPTWEQAFSADQGKTWEINWTMTFERLPTASQPE